MSKRSNKFKFAALAAAVLTFIAGEARAEEKKVELSLWSPSVQLNEPSDDVGVLRLALYGVNQNVTGLDVGFWNVTEGEESGAQWGIIYGETDGDFYGLQYGLASQVKGDFHGADFGFVNLVGGELKGAQIGFVNMTEQLNGVQLGFVNFAKHGYGLQVGLINFFEDGFLECFPFVNFNF